METVRIRDQGWKKVGSGIRDKHPGSATLLLRLEILSGFLPSVFLSYKCFLWKHRVFCFGVFFVRSIKFHFWFRTRILILPITLDPMDPDYNFKHAGSWRPKTYLMWWICCTSSKSSWRAGQTRCPAADPPWPASWTCSISASSWSPRPSSW